MSKKTSEVVSNVIPDNEKLLKELSEKQKEMASSVSGNVASPASSVSVQSDPEIERLRAELRAKEEQLRDVSKKLDESNSMVESLTNASGKAFKPSEGVTLGDAYLFEVKVIDKDYIHIMAPDQAVKQIRCCDECEAKRWYFVTTQDPRNPGKQLNTSVDVVVVCLEEDKRQSRISYAKRISHIRSKADSGTPLTPEENAIFEKEILGLV